MPVVIVQLIEGYAPEDKARLCESLTDAFRLVVPAPVEGVTVMLNEVAPGAYMRGREAKEPAPATPDPVALVKDFLAAMEARDLDTARGHLGDGFAMTFPGGVRMETLEELVAFAAPRYRSVSKTFEGFDVGLSGDRTIVHCRGTLSGVWPDGSAFSGVRFTDRFEIAHGRIVRQDVWNDLAEMRGPAS
ncbi:MAG: nuclear transport factor 2 family protein [Pseudomonadota bacterium]